MIAISKLTHACSQFKKRTLINTTLVVVFMFASLSSFAQQHIRGRVLSASDKSAVPYANIGIENTTVGTLSNEDGTFSVFIPQKHESDTLVFASLGYDRIVLPVRTLLDQKEHTILLVEKTTLLNPVIVVAEKKAKQKSFVLGNRYVKGGFLYADSISAGAAMALLIENKYPSHHAELTYPVLLQSVNAYIHKNSADNFRLRVRFMDVDSISGHPGYDLLPENIIVTSSIRKGWLDIDLRAYKLAVRDRFYVVLEWIMDDSDRLELLEHYATFRKEYPDKVSSDSTIVDGRKVGFWSYHGFSPGTHLGVSPIPFSLQHYTCYYRTHSFGEWKRAPVVLTARVTVTSLIR